jgi:tape measure domain-containing protein
MFDAMSKPLKNITTSMNLMIRAFEKIQHTSNRNVNVDRMLAAAKKSIAAAESEIRRQIERSKKEQDKFNRSVKNGKNDVNGLLNSVRTVAATYLSIQGAKAVSNVSDEYVNTLARLNLINDGMQTTAELQEKIFAAANDSRGVYADMASAVGKLGLLASDAFTSNDEIIAFADLMQKAFRISGAGTMEQQAGMYQLTQAMAAGRLQGDEFRSIMENAPLLAQAIAEFTGKSKGELKELSADGAITADIIKGALFSAADEINEQFEKMPRTFSDVSNQIKNSIIQEMGPAIQRISDMLNNPETEDSLRNIGRLIADLGVQVVRLVGFIAQVSDFMRTNWTVIEPILWGIVGAIIAWQIAQIGLNIALAANPIGLIIMAIAALIGLIIFLVKWIINLWNNNDNFAAALMRAWNSILNFFDRVPIFFQRVSNGITNAFQWAKVESLKLMEKLVNGVIDGYNWLIEKLNKIPGVSLDALSHVEYSAKAAAEAEAIRQAGEEKLVRMEAEAARKAAEREQRVLDFLEDRAARRAREEAEREAERGMGFDYSQWQTASIDKIDQVGEVGKIRDTVDISSEDLKMMRELAEMKSIQNFVSLRPSVRVQTGPISKDVDFDTVMAKIETVLTEQIASSAKGVYGVG